MDASRLRQHLPVTRECIYMNTGWAGPTPITVVRRISQALEHEACVGPASAKGLAFSREVAQEARTALAAFLSADEDDFCLTHGTTEGVNIVLYGIEWGPEDELLICNLEHPALTVPADVLAQRKGVKVKWASISPRAQATEIVQAVRAALSAKTRLVALSHIQYTCGLRMPIKAIAKVAHDRGVSLLVDGAQSVGQVEVNLKELGCDFFALSGQKWLMGPAGTGALFISRDRRTMLEPLFTTNAVESKRNSLRSSLARFSVAAQSPGLVAGFAESMHLAAGIGVRTIEQRIMSLSNSLSEQVASVPGCVLLSPSSPESACGLVTVRLEGWPPRELVAILREQFNIVARAVSNPDGVRFSTAFFNTEGEVHQVAAALMRLASEGRLPQWGEYCR